MSAKLQTTLFPEKFGTSKDTISVYGSLYETSDEGRVDISIFEHAADNEIESHASVSITISEAKELRKMLNRAIKDAEARKVL
jgi:hypothetical protein